MHFRERIDLTSASLSLFIVALFWGAGFTASKAAVSDVPALTSATLRYLFASLALVPLFIRERRRRPVNLDAPPSASWGSLIALALTAVVGYNALYFIGLSYAPSSDAVLLIPTTSPLWTILFAAILVGERPGRRILVGMWLALLGMMMVLLGGFEGSFTSERFTGNVLFVLGAMVFGLSHVMGRLATRDRSPLAATALAGVLGCAVLAPLAVVEGGVSTILEAPPLFWFNILFVALGVTAFAYVLWYRSVSRIGAGRTSFYTNLVPVFGLILSAIFLEEYPTALQIAGGIIMLGAVIWATREKQPLEQVVPATRARQRT